MTFEESVKIIKMNMREGDAKAVADAIGCTRQVLANALKKVSISDMSLTEHKAFDCLCQRINERVESESITTNLAINLAETLTR